MITRLLRGLSANAILSVSQASGLVAIADRGAGRVPTYAMP